MLPASAKSFREISTLFCSSLVVSKENKTIAKYEISTVKYIPADYLLAILYYRGMNEHVV